MSGTLAYWPTTETRERQELLKDLLRQTHDPAEVRPAVLGDVPYDRDLWRRLTTDVGVTAVLAPESVGGLGLGYEDFAAVATELGRVLYTGPYFGSGVLALGALLTLVDGEANDEGDGRGGGSGGEPADRQAAAKLAHDVVTGATVATLAFLDDRGRWRPESAAVTADATAGGWLLRGTRRLVADAPRVDTFCVVAQAADGGPALFAVPAAAARVEPVESIDPTRPIGTVSFDAAPATRLAAGRAAVAAVDAAITLGRLAVAAECVGGAEAALDLTVGYVLSRRQFGRPIGSFQAVKHKCAEALIANEAAKAAVSYAAWALDDRSPEAAAVLLAAKIAGVEAYVRAAADCVQLHGTYGYTREAASQSYFRRARWLSLVLGSVDDDSQALADLLEV